VVGEFAPNTVFAQSVAIPASITVTSLGVVGNGSAGADGILALYSDAGGAPSSLLAATGSAAISLGPNQIPVISPVTISAGTYWIAGEFNASVSLCTDSSTSNTIDFVTTSFGAPPNPFGTASSIKSVDINYYVVGAE
jgi:hypothetical protein